jgi:hypothetical protein
VGFACVWRGFPHLTPTLSAPGGGEGDLQRLLDGQQHAFDVFHYVAIPEANNPVSVTGKLLSARLVFCLFDHVLAAVEFDHQLCGGTGKINNVPTYRMLAAEAGRDGEFT